MAKKQVKLNIPNLKQLSKSPAVMAELEKKAEEVADIASEHGRIPGYKVTRLYREEPRGAVSVMTDHPYAARHNRKNHSLINGLGGVAK